MNLGMQIFLPLELDESGKWVCFVEIRFSAQTLKNDHRRAKSWCWQYLHEQSSRWKFAPGQQQHPNAFTWDLLTVKTQLLVLWWVLDGSEVPACWEPLLCIDRAENSWFLDGDMLLCGRLDSSLAHAQNSNSCQIHSEPFRFSTASMMVVGLKTCPCNHSGNPGHRFKEMVEGNLFIQSKCHCFSNSQDRNISILGDCRTVHRI